ncbi:MAG: HAD family hydrolase [Clostridia bacterium]|nr:HAD family hydrolase [Clostridia bacterium]
MTYKNILWDWNGTILNDTPVAFEATNILLARYGYPQITLDFYKDNMETPVVNFYAKIFDLSRHSMDQLDAEWCVLYNALSPQIALHQGAKELLEALHDKGFHQAVLSAFQTEIIEDYAKRFGVDLYFHKILGTRNIVAESKTLRGKAYMAENHLNPRETLYIGDTVHDFETARDLGTDCILFSQGQQSPGLLRACGVPVCESYAELMAAIG